MIKVFFSFFTSFILVSHMLAQIPAGYYDAATGETGYQLKTALKNIITNGHTDQGYDALYTLYQNGDVDNYFENDQTLLDMYSEKPWNTDSYEYTQTADKCTGSNSAEGDCYNREHIMPQSVFSSAAPMKNDGHFVVPSDGYVNNRRSNYAFGAVSNPTWTSTNGSKVGPNTTAGYSDTVFEPLDEFKGDIARMLFYFVTRYEDQVASWSHPMLNGTSDQAFSDWFLDVLLQWNTNDPVSQREIDRNEAVYSFQGNRNPYIDHPEWVDEVWNSNRNTASTCIDEDFVDFSDWTDSGTANDTSSSHYGNASPCRAFGTNDYMISPSVDNPNTLDFHQDASSGGNGSSVTLEYKIGTGSWVQFYTFNVDENGVDESIDLTSLSGVDLSAETNVTFKFSSTFYTWYLDDVVVQCGAASGTGPTITNITQTPTSVTSSDTVSVSADVTDPDGINGVELHWGTTSGSLTNTITMNLSSGNTYTTNTAIPAQADGTTVYYEIYAIDNNTDDTTSPEQSYTVDDNPPCASELIISEVVENGNQKYIEIANFTGSSVSLIDYDIVIYSNGNTSPNSPIDLTDTGSIADNDVWVLAYSSASVWSGTADQTSGSFNPNGNDVIALRKSSTNIDVFGVIGDSSYFYDDEKHIRNTNINGPTSTYNSVEWTITSYNGTDDPTTLSSHTMTCAACTEPSTDAVFHANSPQSITTTSLTLNWTNGDGENRIVVMREANPVSFVPVDGTSYTGNSDYSAATDVSGNGEYVVYNGNATTVDITGLTPGTLYYAVIYEYSCAPGSEDYYTSGTPTTDSFYTTPEKPDTFTAECVGATSIDLSWTAPATGNFDGYLVVAREGVTPHSVLSLDPNTNLGDNLDYSAAATFGSTSPYSHILYKGTGASANITGLTNGTSYTFEVFAYSANGTLYRYSAGKTMTNTIDLQNVTSASTATGNTQLTVGWTNPSASCYDEILVVVNDASGITFTPSGDGSAYTANTVYAANNQVVYKGTGNQVTVTGLTNGTTYYFEIFVRKGTDWSSGVETNGVPNTSTTLDIGDLAILAVNTDIDNQPGSTGDGSGDQIAFVCFKDITPNTKIFLTDNGYEREVAGKWGNTEGVIAITRLNSTLQKGTIIILEANANTNGNISDPSHFDIYTCGAIDGDWQKEFVAGTGGFNLNNDDDIWIMQGGIWNNGTSNNHDATYDGNVLYGWTESGWDNGVGNGTNGTKWSNLFPNSKCFTTIAPTGDGKVKFNDPNDPDFSTTTNDQLDWIALINTSGNWDTYTTNANYNSGGFDYKGDANCPQLTIASGTHTNGKWTGINNTNWFDCANWDDLTVPDETIDVTLANATNNATIDATATDSDIYNDTAQAHNLTILSGSTLTMQNTANDLLEVYGNWNNQAGEASFIEGTGGTVKFMGNVAQTVTSNGGVDTEKFYNLEINNATGVTFSSGNIHAAGDLTLTNSPPITITATHYMLSGNTLTNNTTVTINNEASLVQTASGADSNLGSGSYIIHKTTQPYAEYDYTYWSSPVSNESIGDAFNTNSSLSAGSSTNSTDSSPANHIYSLDTSHFNDGGDADEYDDEGDDWIPEAASTTMTPAKGYIAMGAGSDFPFNPSAIATNLAQSVHFDGQVNNGDITYSVVLDNDSGDGFTNQNLIGNPYPSAIDINKLYTQNSSILEGTFYFWTHDSAISAANPGPDAYNFNNDDYATVTTDGTTLSYTSGSNGTSATQYIASGQGFLADVTQAGTLTFTNAMRETGNNTHFLRYANSGIDRLWLNLTKEDIGIFRQIYIGFHDNATDTYQDGQDGQRMENGINTDFYSKIAGDERRFAIQNLATFNTEKTVNLGIEIVEAGTYEIDIDRMEGVFTNGQAVYLEDTYENIIHDIANGAYTFTSEVGDAIEDRFILRFTNDALSLDDAILNSIKVYPNPASGIFTISLQSDDIVSVEVYNSVGNLVKRQFTGYQIDLSGFAKGIYFAKISINGNQVVKKLILR